MSRKVAFSPWLLLMVVIAFTVVAFGQTTASIKGAVTDSTGAAVAGATVNIKGLGIDRTTQTNAAGDYEVPALRPGQYTVHVEMKGFQPQQATGVTLQVSQNSVQNFKLQVASASEVITVEATAPVIETTTVTVGQVINQRTVQDIPLNGRHFVDLALLVPGTVTPPQNGFLTAPLRGQGSFAFNTAGNREDAVNFMINGINLNDMVQNQVTFQPTINTVSEFKVDNSTYSAEYGRNSGAIVNIATRSGTNEFHGELYDYLRNDFFDARNAFNPKFTQNGSAQRQGPFKRNQFGADFGGPIIRDKSFFFLSYEGLRHRQGLPIASTVLSDTQRAQIQSSTNTVAQALLPLIPAANAPNNQFLGSVTAPVDIDQGTADINHKINEADSLHGYYVYQRDLRQETAAGTTIPGFGDTRDGHRQVLTLSETHVFSPNTVNEARLGANRIHLTFTPNNTTNPSSLGLAGPLGPNQQFIPTIRLADIGLTFGSERNFPQGRGDTTGVLADTLSYIRGRHSFKFGGEFRDFRNDNFNNDPGQLVFNTTSNFISGTLTCPAPCVDSSARTLGNVANRINQNALDFFAQDSWKLKSYLTFELGLRYAWNMTPSEAKGRFINFDPLTSSLVSSDSPYAQNNKNFQPRVGFSWDLFRNGNTILRGAYAYQVDQPITGIVTGLSSNPPLALPISVGKTSLGALAPAYDPNNAANLAPLFVNPDFKNADVQSWNLNIQQQITKSTALMIGYFGTKGTHLEIDRNINQYATFGSIATSTSSTRPFQALSPSSEFLPGKTLTTQNITERDSSSNSIYNALWITANRRMSRNLQFNASYTWSHSIDDASRNNQGLVVQDSKDIFSSRGSSDFDARHRFVANAIYDVPFKGNRLISGWEIAPIVSLQSGNPFNVVLATSNITGAANTVRPNVTAPLQISGNPFGQWIANPQVLQAPAPGTLGNLGRNSVVGPDFKNFDLALIKNTKITERFTAQFRADTFNVFNHINFGQPIPQGGGAASLVFTPPPPGGTVAPSFSTINSTRFPTGDSGSSRQIQLALRLLF
jgi:outer membrane receptor protein involved in Fe transport